MPKYRITIGETICPGQSQVALAIPGRRVLFDRVAGVRSVDVELEEKIASYFQATGYGVELLEEPKPKPKKRAKKKPVQAETDEPPIEENEE